MNYSFLAENEYVVKQELNKLLKQLSNKYDCELVEHDAHDKDFNLDSVLNDLNTYPFLNEHRVVIVNNPSFLSSSKSLEDRDNNHLENYLKNPADFSTLIFYVDSFKVDNRKKTVKILKKYTEVFEAKALDERSIESIIRNDLIKSDVHIENAGIAELVRRMIPQFDNWPMELEKLILNKEEIIDELMIKLLITVSEGDNIFDLVNAVLNKNLRQALRIYRNLSQSEKEAIPLIMLLASQFRLLHQVKTLSDDRLDERSIASELKVHPYRVKMAAQMTRKYSYLDILSILNKLASLEQGIKNGIVNPDIGFELFLIEATH